MSENTDQQNSSKQDISSNEKSIKTKLFNFYYQMSKSKTQINQIVLCIFTIIEAIQLISYAFLEKYRHLWKVNESNLEYLSYLLNIFRISPSKPSSLKFNAYAVIFYIILAFIFILYFLVIFKIMSNSSMTNNITELFIIMIIINVLILLYLPITELMLIPIDCIDGKIKFISDYKCWNNLHYLYAILGIVCSLMLLLLLISASVLYFYPFHESFSTYKLSPFNDILLLIVKLIYVLNNMFNKNVNLSIVIYLVLSLLLINIEFSYKSYKNQKVEIAIYFRNFSVFWTYLILLLNKIFYDTRIDGQIYLLAFGYILLLYCSIIFVKNNNINFIKTENKTHNIDLFLKYTINLVNGLTPYFGNYEANSNYDKFSNTDTLVEGNIRVHIEKCIREDCPLTRFIKNRNNPNIQKQALLSYMAIHFNNGIKIFPTSAILRIYYIHFNYSQRYNLNSVRTNLNELKQMSKNIHEEFLTYCLEKDIKEMDTKSSDSNFSNDAKFETELIEIKYQRLKNLIENTTKLYVEFWSIFYGSMTKLNTKKLYSLGPKLNSYLNEMNDIWNKHLKHRKIDFEHQGILLLYSKFLKEVLWNKTKYEELSNKIKTEYNLHQEKRNLNKNNLNMPDLDSVIENQHYLLFANSNDKGECKIAQYSFSLISLLGYQKSELIGKPIEILLPSLLEEEFRNMLEEKIKKNNNLNDSEVKNDGTNDKNYIFVLMKNKIGYLIPLSIKFIIYDDSDYSNSYIIKFEIEPKDTKSVYAYYILTKPDLTIDNISSSALHLGLTMDLLKKYLINMNLLIRTKDDETLNLFNDYKNFIEEPKEIIWVYPNIIYPKENSQQQKDTDIQNLIKLSQKKSFNLQINELIFNKDNLIGFSLRIIEISKKNKKKIKTSDYHPKNNNQEIIFDLLNLNYVRTILVKEKSGFRNLRHEEENESLELSQNNISSSKHNKIKTLKTNKNMDVINETSEEENNQQLITLTKEKILELQGSNSVGIKNFIFSLPFFGKDISLEKLRPNKEKYSAGKATEPSIKIELSHFTHRIEEKIRSDPNLLKKFRKNLNKEASMEQTNNNDNNNYLSSTSSIPTKESNNKSIDELSREISDVSSSLKKLFKDYSLKKILLAVCVAFFIIILLSTIEFILSLEHINLITTKITHFKDELEVYSIIAYIKFYITEAVLANELSEKYIGIESLSSNNFIEEIKTQLTNYRLSFTEKYSVFTSTDSTFSKAFLQYINYETINISTLSNGIPTIEQQPISACNNRIPSNLFSICTATDKNSVMNMKDRSTYELMTNLLNSYFITWQKMTTIIGLESRESTTSTKVTLIVLILSFVGGIIIISFYYQAIVNIFFSSEKPIHLILTIKKKIFEDLKNCAETFANKLLNKFFGNEESEEEAQLDYQSNVQMNDINIVKFKSPNPPDYNCKSYLKYMLQIFIFVISVEVYFFFKTIHINSFYGHVQGFIDVFNATAATELYTIMSVNLIKSFLYNDTIPIFNYEHKYSRIVLVSSFYSITQMIENTIIETTTTKCFLKNNYISLFNKYLFEDFSELVKNNINIEDYKNYTSNGFRPILTDIYETIRKIDIKFFSDKNNHVPSSNEGKTNELINDFSWIKLNMYVRKLMKYFFRNILTILYEEYENYISSTKVIYISTFIALLVFLVLYYAIVWNRYYAELAMKIKVSQDLVNLIPEEIKYLIISKINE